MKYIKHKSKRFKQMQGIIILLLVPFTIITVMALWQSSFTVENRFPIEFLEVSINEEFNPPEKWDGTLVTKKAVFKNEGTIPAVVRVQIVENFNLNGKLLSTKYLDAVVEKDIVVKNISTNWTKRGNWYYYNKILDSNTDTGAFLESIQYDASLPVAVKNSIKGATYELSLVQEHVSIYDTSLKNIWDLKNDFILPSDFNDAIKWN